jgi:hypothetical protein
MTQPLSKYEPLDFEKLRYKQRQVCEWNIKTKSVSQNEEEILQKHSSDTMTKQ